MLGAFFQIKALQAPFLPKFSLTCLKRTKQIRDLQKTAMPFLQNHTTCSDFAKVFTRFSQISTDFARILSGFSPN